MKPSCCNSLILFLLLGLGILWGKIPEKSVLVYYGNDLSWPLAGSQDYIIVEPSHIATDTHGFRTYRDKVFAYVSLGEIADDHPLANSVKKAWILGYNKTWKSRILNLGNPKLRSFLMERLIAPLYRRGFRNFFFDTLDAHRIALKDPNRLKAQEAGLVTLIREVHHRYPHARIILNRGFGILDKVADSVDAVLFESYYRGLDAKLRYAPVTESDRHWIDTRLQHARTLGLDIIALDYLPDPGGPEAQKLAQRLAAKGFIPYIGNKDLDRYGTSLRHPIKREILLLFNGKDAAPEFQSAHLYASMPLEYLGYIPILKDIRTAKLTEHDYERYAGAIVWIESSINNPKRLYSWVRANAKHGMYTLFLGSFGTELSEARMALSKLGVTLTPNRAPENQLPSMEKLLPWMHCETTPVVQTHEWMVHPPRASQKLLSYRRGDQHSTLAALTPWGGYALDEAAMVAFGDENLWTANPFILFPRALRLRKFPIPDPTTENGLRLFFSHIDGDGIMNRAEWNPKLFSGDVIYQEILKKYPVPHSVSVVVGEIAPFGLYPKLSPRLVALAKSIYALPNVEAATHTFSHPFDWGKITASGDLAPQYRLKIPGYRFSIDKELRGSLEYIDTLLPPDKPNARTIFWSGDCLPGEKILHYAYAHRYLNMNGGDTTITNDNPWLGRVAPFGLRRGPYWQIYTGAQNENVYTNEFHGPYWGFRKVIQTFQLTDRPRRFKAIDIYYHFYSGSKRASLRALQKVFDWAMEQKTYPLYASEYIPKVMEFYDAAISRERDGYRFDGLRALRTLRLDANTTRLPDMNRSSGLLGYRRLPQGTYLSLDGNGTAHIQFGENLPDVSRLISANGRLIAHQRDRYTFEAHVPLSIRWHLTPECSLKADPPAPIRRQNGAELLLRYRQIRKATIHVRCR